MYHVFFVKVRLFCGLKKHLCARARSQYACPSCQIHKHPSLWAAAAIWNLQWLRLKNVDHVLYQKKTNLRNKKKLY